MNSTNSTWVVHNGRWIIGRVWMDYNDVRGLVAIMLLCPDSDRFLGKITVQMRRREMLTCVDRLILLGNRRAPIRFWMGDDTHVMMSDLSARPEYSLLDNYAIPIQRGTRAEFTVNNP